MKRIIIALISLILLTFCLIGCATEETFYGWIDDVDALSIKLNRMNQSEVHYLLGQPVALLMGSESEVYLNSEDIGVFIHYDADGEVVSVEEEYNESKKEFKIAADMRCKIMNMLIGRTREEIINRYGEPDSVSKDLSVMKYKNFDGVKVSILFDKQGLAQKLSLSVKKKEDNLSSDQGSTVEKEDSVALLNDMTALRKKTIGMKLSDFLTLFGKPKGVMETDNCRVYFDSNKDCVFFYFDEQLKVKSVEKFYMTDLKNKDYYCMSDEELLTSLMNKLIGKNQDDVREEYGRTRYILTTPNAYGYINLYGKQVNVYYDSNNLLEKIEINVYTNDFADKDISEIRAKSIGRSPDDNEYFIDAYRGYVNKENCVVRLNSRGDAIVLYYEEGGDTIKRVEKLDGEAIKLNGAKNDIEKMVTILHHFSGKEKEQIEKEFGQPDIKVEFSDNYMGYKNIYGNKLMVLYRTDIIMNKTEMVYVFMY